MELVLNLAFFSVAGVICIVLVKKNTPEIGMSMALLLTGVVTFFALNIFAKIQDFMNEAAASANVGQELLTPMYKLIGIAVVTKLCSDMCRDAKETAVASAVEILGCTVGVYIALPLISAVLQLIGSLL